MRQLPSRFATVLSLVFFSTFPSRASFAAVVDADAAASWGTEEEIRQLLAASLSIPSAVHLSLLADPFLRARALEPRIAEVRLNEAGRLPNPEFEVEARPAKGGSEGESGEVEVTLAWDVARALRSGLRRRAASADLESAKAAVASAIALREYEVEAAFQELLAARRLVAIARLRAEAASVAADAARAIVSAGNAAELTALQDEAAAREAALASAEAALREQEASEQLSLLLGAGAIDGVRDAVSRIDEGTHEMAIPDVDSAGLEDAAVAANHDLLHLRARLSAVHSRARLARSSGYFPSVELRVLARREDGAWSPGAALAVSLPVFDRGEGRSQSLEAERRMVEEEIRAAEGRIRSSARLVAGRYNALRERAASYLSQVVPLRERITAETLLHANAMQLGIGQLLAARDGDLRAAAEAASALRDVAVQAAAIKALRAGVRPEAPRSIPINTSSSVVAEKGGH